ncbi:hypothetical protein MKP08_08325 [Erythrobacter sp. LQ02-29]|uniref:hypothetical protein n=1 Tax=Erythrobacter sp. LQ02-29 TaxID=2920384 RepID=UPI00211ADC5D|nr:hypothetical protein [Erythrobacter sp. LQ02-29]MCP9222749.1 hypothetical protein [Erythrobacter sp. LQ02-29]
MARYRIDSLGDLHRHGYWIRITCRHCGRVIHANPAALTVAAIHLDVSRSIERLARKLRCSRCGRKRPDLQPCYPPG